MLVSYISFSFHACILSHVYIRILKKKGIKDQPRLTFLSSKPGERPVKKSNAMENVGASLDGRDTSEESEYGQFLAPGLGLGQCAGGQRRSWRDEVVKAMQRSVSPSSSHADAGKLLPISFFWDFWNHRWCISGNFLFVFSFLW